MEPIILASTSPRRQEILKSLGIPFSVMTPSYTEEPVPGLSAHELAELHSMNKVESVIRMKLSISVPWVLGADTVIFDGQKILGKPAHREDAQSMLESFSGKKHEVITAISLYDSHTNFTTTKTCTSSVEFMPLDHNQIESYLDTGEWQGAAGGYRIQGLASFFISRIEGSWSGIVGLPIHDLYVILREHGYRFGE
ncbi:MAG: septum formation protein Maf [Spirochaetales bacterium]|nr:septum formation protein Maf [Spirochaetales bacterium]